MTKTSTREMKSIAGIAAVMFGVAQGLVPFVNFYPMVTGGIIALFGGIYIIDQVQDQDQGDSGVDD